MSDDSIAERVRPVYKKDLYEDYFSLNVRIDSDKLEHGDKIHVQVRKLPDSPTEPEDSEETEGDSKESSSMNPLSRLKRIVPW